MRPRRELGSEWHTVEVPGPPGELPWARVVHVGTGRDALWLVIEQVRPRRIWVPTYGCPSFLAVLTGWELVPYPDRPTQPFAPPPSEVGDAVIVHNPFGLRGKPAGRSPGVWIEDHSHAPFSAWARSSEADWCVASVRKVLPTPDGGVLWSPAGHPLPPEPVGPHPSHDAAVADKLAGMEAKARYLAGAEVDKEAFRALLARGEAGLGQHPPAPMSAEARAVLANVDPVALRAARARNFAALAVGLRGARGVAVVRGADRAPSFGFVVFDDPARRDAVRARLIANGVYPSGLWPVSESLVPVLAEDLALAARSFAIPVDLRARAEELAWIAAAIVSEG